MRSSLNILGCIIHARGERKAQLRLVTLLNCRLASAGKEAEKGMERRGKRATRLRTGDRILIRPSPPPRPPPPPFDRRAWRIRGAAPATHVRRILRDSRRPRVVERPSPTASFSFSRRFIIQEMFDSIKRSIDMYFINERLIKFTDVNIWQRVKLT